MTVRPPRLFCALSAVTARRPQGVQADDIAQTHDARGHQMKMTGLTTLDHAPQVVAAWLHQLEESLGWDSRARSYMLLRATLHALRDWLSVNEAADLAAQLPVLLRGIYYEGWDPSATPVTPRSKTAFVERVAGHFEADPLEDTEAAIATVFTLLATHVSAGEVAQVSHALRKPLQGLWP